MGCGSPPSSTPTPVAPAPAGTIQSREFTSKSGLPVVRRVLEDGTLRIAIKDTPIYKVEVRVPWTLNAKEQADFKKIVPERSKPLFAELEKTGKQKLNPTWVQFGDTAYYRAVTEEKGLDKWIGYTVFGDNCAVTGAWLPKDKMDPRAAQIRATIDEALKSLAEHAKKKAH